MKQSECYTDNVLVKNIAEHFFLQLQGSLMVAGVVHALLGFTGLIGFLLKFVGPLTIVPTLVLIFIFIIKPVLKFVEVNWGIAMS